MNPVIESLLDILETDPLPEAHTSSHWQHYGRDTIVERRGDDVVSVGSRSFSLYRPSIPTRFFHYFTRQSYRPVAEKCNSYPSIWQVAKRLARDLSAGLTFDVFKSTMALGLLAEHWAAHRLSPRTFALIGDGHGFLGALVRRYLSGSRVYSIDLPIMLVFQARTHEMADGQARLSLLSANGANTQTDVIFVLPQNIECIPDQIDCAINIASMQEMTDFSINSYFTFLRRRSTQHSRFYCVNRLRKELLGGEVTSFHNYPWQENDEIFIDGPCPYYTHFFAPYTLPNGPRVLGLRVPFVNYFDGILMHRLARLAPIP